MSSIFIVTDGNYSDYHIIAAFSTRDLAEAFVAGSGIGDVEEHPLDRCEMIGLRPFALDMDWDGRAGSIREGYSDSLKNNIHPFDNEYQRTDPAWTHASPDHVFSGLRCDQVWARDEQHAIKIVNEYRIQYLAEHGRP